MAMLPMLPLLALVVQGAEPAVRAFGPAPAVAWRNSELSAELPDSFTRLLGAVGSVCVTGDDRVGKSTLLTAWAQNLTARDDFVFPAGQTRESLTKGLWSAILPAEATGLEFHLNLCDSQGLKQVSELEQWRLFAANVLIPQILVYMTINVVQNDQLRDLARMAHQFQLLANSSDAAFARFGRVLSPHLIVVVREESDLDGEPNEDGRNLTTHLEKALSSTGFSEDKALIRRIFTSREAWSLEELPLEARRALRTGGARHVAGQRWRRSGEVVLQRTISALRRRQQTMPQSGLALGEWYRSVVATVNSRDEGALERLIGHTERLDVARQRQLLLQDGFGRILALLAGLALLSAFAASLGHWLDRLAWVAWICLAVCFLGASPLLRTPLGGVAQRYCDQVLTKALDSWMRQVCLEASAQTMAGAVASVLGALSYPLLTRQLQWLLALLPLPAQLHRSFVLMLLVLLAACLVVLQEAVSELAFGDQGSLLFASGAASLMLAVLFHGTKLMQQVLQNRSFTAAGDRGRALHFYIAERDATVAELEETVEWKLHYRIHSSIDCFWRFRREGTWQRSMQLAQAGGLLIWAWLTFPCWDALFAAGSAGNALHLSHLLARWLRRRWQSTGEDEVGKWLASLEEEEESDEVSEAPEEASPSEPPIIPETFEEVQLRMEIEQMRQEQERSLARCRLAAQMSSRQASRPRKRAHVPEKL